MTDDAPAPYPSELEREIVLRDGARLKVRPIHPADEPRLVALYDRLSRHTAYQRFFTVSSMSWATRPSVRPPGPR